MTTLPGIEQVRQGQRLYVSTYVDTDGLTKERIIIADQWDRLNKPAHGIKMKKDPKFKGDNVCRKMLFIKDKKSY